ncbi:MAG: GxxExxY protein, partial [Deltaproteobacteria bacterium]
MDATDREALNDLATKVIGAIYEVSNILGVGFLESVYERALVKELALRGIKARRQAPVKVKYKDEVIGKYRADVLVEGKLIIEVKCADGFVNEHMAQCINYLRAADLNLCLIVNFKKAKAVWKRIV